MKNLIGLLAFMALASCQTSSTQVPAETPKNEKVASSAASSAASLPARANEARKRLEKSAAGKIVLRSTDRHGGLERWFAQRAIQFRYDYVPVKGLRRNSLQTIDVHRARAYHDLEDFGAFSWTGEEAFKEFTKEYPVRFWALTPFYFVGLPFVLSDAGVTLEILEGDSTTLGLPEADIVKATFSVGDAPDDYYILYFAKDDGRLLATRYIVTYAPFYKADPSRKPKEKILYFADLQEHEGLVFAARHDFYMMQEERRGEKVTVSTLSEVKVNATFDESRMQKSENAIVDAFE